MSVGAMRAAVVSAPRRIDIRGDVPVPAPKDDEVLVRLEGSGVCGSNLPVWQGRPWFTYPLEPGAPGHEGWGRVLQVGSRVTGVAPGGRVAMITSHAYAEYDVAPAADVVPVPEGLEGTPCPGEPLACAVNVIRRSDLHPGQRVAIVGIGFLGALLTRLSVLAGAEVTAFSRRACALEMARVCGATHTVSLANRDVADVERAVAQAGGQLFDRTIEAVGLQASLDLAAGLTAERGRLVIAGYHQDGPRQVNMQLWNWRGLDVINAHERDPRVYVEGMRTALELLARGDLDPGPLYTHRVPLDEAQEAFSLMDRRPDGFFKALVLA